MTEHMPNLTILISLQPATGKAMAILQIFKDYLPIRFTATGNEVVICSMVSDSPFEHIEKYFAN